jgi:hypothetical protein
MGFSMLLRYNVYILFLRYTQEYWLHPALNDEVQYTV